MKGLVGRVALGVAAGVAVYIGFTIWADAGRVGAALRQFSWGMAALACLLAACNYLIRFGRWQLYLRVLGLKVAARDSLMVFLAGFSLTVTPGKLGEAVKAFLLRATHGYPVARTAPIVIAERVTDLLALLLLALVGVFQFDVDRRFLVAGAVVVLGGVLVVSIDPLAELALAIAARLPGLRKFAPKLREMHVATAALLHPKPLVLATAISTVSWFFECLAFWAVVRGFPGAGLGLRRDLHLRRHDDRGRPLLPARRPGRHRGGHAGAAREVRHGPPPPRGGRRHVRHARRHAVVRRGAGPAGARPVRPPQARRRGDPPRAPRRSRGCCCELR
jgi:uncharacterized membrane protein YbhN (UPF0104 family)